MRIKHRFQFVEGDFETETGKLICVQSHKYRDVELCFKEGWNIPFAKIKLYSKNLFVDADAVFESAVALGEEICKRWNCYFDNCEPEPEK